MGRKTLASRPPKQKQNARFPSPPDGRFPKHFLQVYFAKLLSGRGERSKEGTLWVYSDAHVCVVEKDRALITVVKEIKLSAE